MNAATTWVLHVDMDEFLAAVEVLRRPELAGRPVVVGGRGDPKERAVVSTASYAAREHGVRSGMPLKTAVRTCPEAVFLPLDHAHYEAVSAAVLRTLRAHPGAVVQTLGWDEAFVGLETDDPRAEARAVRDEVLAATGLHCSVGIGDTTVRAKTATAFGKPAGTFMLTAETWYAVMGERPTTALWGIGKRIGERLSALGIETVHDLGHTSDAALADAFGPTIGPRLRGLGQGLGATRVDDTPRVARAHGHETTYQRDLRTTEEIAAALRTLAGQVIDDLRAEGRPCQRVHLKVRFTPFSTVTRVRTLREPTLDADAVIAIALDLLAGLDDDRPIRLLGIRGEMVPPGGGY